MQSNKMLETKVEAFKLTNEGVMLFWGKETVMLEYIKITDNYQQDLNLSRRNQLECRWI